MKNLFVTGTDTEVGKTFICGLLCYAFSKNKKTAYFKPIQAGAPTDFDRVVRLCPDVDIKKPVYNLKVPASPNRAAEAEGIEISIPKILAAWKESQGTLIEGAGGLLVPINKNQKIIDLCSAMDVPVILVASTRLGTINHTLLSVEALKQRGIPCVGIILNGPKDAGLRELLEEQTGLPILFEIEPQEEESSAAFEKMISENEDLRGFIDFWSKEENSSSSQENLKELDSKHVWHPFTQHGIVKNHGVVSRGRGSYITVNGREVIDGISSWWVNLLGHCHPRLVLAVQEQVAQLEHVIFAGFSHEPAISLSKKLVDLCRQRGTSLEKVFFSDNGSTSVEVALKMAYQYHQQQGHVAKKKFLAFRGSYHGDTLGAMSVGEREGFNKVFNNLMFEVDFVNPFRPEELEQAFAQEGSRYAGVIFEPMVQGASGMRMYGAELLNRLQELCREHHVFTICDEVFTGFFRTGKCFAFEHSQLRPDFLCLSKGLTGGFLPLAATLTSHKIFDSFQGDDMRHAFLHGHSYTANPIACAVANATLDELDCLEIQGAIRNISQWTKQWVDELSDQVSFFNGRSLGTIGAMEISDEDPNYFKGDFSYHFHQAAMKRGVLLRPLGGTLYAVPPYCIEKSELDKIYKVMWSTLKEEF